MTYRAFVLLSLISMVFSTAKVALPQAHSRVNSANVARMQRKLEHIESNAVLSKPDPAPTEFTEDEVNAYLASDQIKLPAGVKSVKLQGQPGVITGNSQIDFDQVKAGKSSYNPLLSVFTGVHQVVVIAHAYGEAGQGFVHVDSVALDGVEIPRFALQLFVEKYLQPKYPDVGLDSRFKLPDRMDHATVGLHKLSVVQK
jgi:hypothetical protein